MLMLLIQLFLEVSISSEQSFRPFSKITYKFLERPEKKNSVKDIITMEEIDVLVKEEKLLKDHGIRRYKENLMKELVGDDLEHKTKKRH